MKRIVIWFFFFCISIAIYAQEGGIKRSRVIETYKGKKYYIHFVDEGQTLYAIARAYEVSAEQIKQINPESGESLKLNQMLMIPFLEVDGPKQTVVSTEDKDDKKVLIIASTDQQLQKDSSRLIQHTVVPKETWYALSRQYKVPVQEIISINPGVDTLKIGMTVFIPHAKAAVADLPPRPGYYAYQVASQETLYGIASQQNLTIEQLVTINPVLKEGLKAGQWIYLPGKENEETAQTSSDFVRHEVQRRETLYSISKQYNIEIKDILQVNPGMDGRLRKNDIILIPNKKKSKAVDKPVQDAVVHGRDINLEAVTPRPVRTGNCTNQPHDQVFNVALLIPFQLNYTDSISMGEAGSLKSPSEYRSFDFIQFYEGALIAADDAADEGLKVKLHVFDADAGNGTYKINQLLSSASLKNMDLIIGPFFVNSFEKIAEFAKDHKIPIVNPLSQRSEILDDNPFVIKMQPSMWSVYSNTARKIVEAYPEAHFTLMRRNDAENSSMASVFQSALSKVIADPGQLHEIVYSQEHETGLIKTLVAGKQNVIFMLTSDKALIPALLRRLNDVQEKYNITVVGLTDWQDMEMDLNYLNNLNGHFFSPWFVDYSSPQVLRFIGEFRRRYEGEPEQVRYAYHGYDFTRYFLDAMYNYGPDFLNCITEIHEPMLSSDFRFYEVPSGGYENTGVAVYKLNNFKMELLK
ncbi:MAG: LysM peptidoglycan-binding domain-containing protein [Lentimicrobium sp.]|nr:LysM peptidoglycan-binding domain-containing protein [Lentimicrobium sp.]